MLGLELTIIRIINELTKVTSVQGDVFKCLPVTSSLNNPKPKDIKFNYHTGEAETTQFLAFLLRELLNN